MKNLHFKKSFVLVLFSLFMIVLTSCNASQNTCEQCNDGQDGKDGVDGNDGKDGISFLSDKGAPSKSLGNDGDTYMDVLTADIYKKEDGVWTKISNLLTGELEVSNLDKPIIFYNRIPTNANGTIDTDLLKSHNSIYYVGYDEDTSGNIQGNMIVDYFKDKTIAEVD